MRPFQPWYAGAEISAFFLQSLKPNNDGLVMRSCGRTPLEVLHFSLGVLGAGFGLPAAIVHNAFGLLGSAFLGNLVWRPPYPSCLGAELGLLTAVVYAVRWIQDAALVETHLFSSGRPAFQPWRTGNRIRPSSCHLEAATAPRCSHHAATARFPNTCRTSSKEGTSSGTGLWIVGRKR